MKLHNVLTSLTVAGSLIALAPVGVALADDFGPSVFTGSPGKDALRAITNSPTTGTAISASGGEIGVEADGKFGVSATGSGSDGAAVLARAISGTGVDASSVQGTALKASSEKGTAIEAKSSTIAVRAESRIGSSINTVGVEASGHTGVKARGSIGVAAVGSTASNGIGVDAKGHTAIRAVGTGGTAIDASCVQAPGSFCFGVFARGDEGVVAQGKHIGVEASSELTTGVAGSSTNGVGGRFRGGKAALQLQPQTTAGKPTSGNHERGEMLMDSTGVLFVCTAPGTPGTWKKVVLQ